MRRYTQRSIPEEAGYFYVMNEDFMADFEEFKSSNNSMEVKENTFLPFRSFLPTYLKERGLSIVKTVLYNTVFVLVPTTMMDDLCEWISEKQMI